MPSPGEPAPGKALAFPPESAELRDAAWSVAAADAANSVVIVVDSLDKTFGLEALLHAQRDAAVRLQLDPDGFLFSYIQAFSERPECVLPDRGDMTYSTHCLRSYARHVLDVANRRGASVTEPPADEPGLFLAGDDSVVADDLLQVPRGRITEQGMRQNIRIALQGIASILAGTDLATNRSTIELCRAQLWQWVQHETGVLDAGQIISTALFDAWLDEELAEATGEKQIEAQILERAAQLLGDTTRAAVLLPSLVDEAYRLAE